MYWMVIFGYKLYYQPTNYAAVYIGACLSWWGHEAPLRCNQWSLLPSHPTMMEESQTAGLHYIWWWPFNLLSLQCVCVCVCLHVMWNVNFTSTSILHSIPVCMYIKLPILHSPTPYRPLPLRPNVLWSQTRLTLVLKVQSKDCSEVVVEFGTRTVKMRWGSARCTAACEGAYCTRKGKRRGREGRSRLSGVQVQPTCTHKRTYNTLDLCVILCLLSCVLYRECHLRDGAVYIYMKCVRHREYIRDVCTFFTCTIVTCSIVY